MWFDRLWYRIWVPLAFLQTLIVMKWAVWGADLFTIAITVAVASSFLVRLIVWQIQSDPY